MRPMPINMQQVYPQTVDSIIDVWNEALQEVPGLLSILDHVLVGDIIEAMSGHSLPQTSGDIFHHGIAWRGFGSPIFRLTTGLASGLILTDSGKMPWDQVNFPYPSFAVSLPPGIVFFDNFDGKVLEASFITVDTFKSFDRHQDAEKAARMMMRAGGTRNYQATVSAINDMIQFVRECPSSLCVMTRTWASQQPSATLHYKSPPIISGATVNDILGSSEHSFGEVMTSRDEAANHAVSRIIVNLCSYLQTTDDKTDKRVWTPQSKTVSRKPGSTVWEVGHNVKLPREVHQAARAFSEDHKGTTWKQFVRSGVRGHMHGYWHGPKSDPTKREFRKKWIMPYMRGPKDAPIIPKVYDVDEKK